MARSRDLVIEQCLRQIVREAFAKDEEITARLARNRTESELGLPNGFFKSDAMWKQKSADIIQDVIEEDDAEPAPTFPARTAASKPKPPQPPSDRPTGNTNFQNGTTNTPKSKSTAAGTGGSNRKLSKEQVEEDKTRSGEYSVSETDVSRTAQIQRPENRKEHNGLKRKAGEQSSSDEDSGSEDELSAADEGKPEIPQKKKSRRETAADGDISEGNSEEDSESDESHQDSSSSGNNTDTPVQPVPPIPAKAFTAPSGFTQVEPEQVAVVASLPASRLDGKQIWHITASSKLSLSLIKEISLDALQSGQTVHTESGIEYVLKEDVETDGDTCTVMLPTTGGYQCIEQNIERAFRLQQKISLPNLSIRQADQNSGSSAAAKVGASAISAVRPQPKGLRMRYKPPGFGSSKVGIPGSESDSDEDETIARNAIRHTDLTQRVNELDVDDETAGQLSKKLKNKGKSKDGHVDDQPKANDVRNPSSGSRSVAKSTSQPLVNGTPAAAPGKDERKKQKRERKEAKQRIK